MLLHAAKRTVTDRVGTNFDDHSKPYLYTVRHTHGKPRQPFQHHPEPYFGPINAPSWHVRFFLTTELLMPSSY